MPLRKDRVLRFPLSNPSLDFLHPLRVFLQLPLDEVVAVFAVAEAVATGHVVIILKRTKDFLIVFVILLIVAQEALQVLKVGLDVLAGGKSKMLFHKWIAMFSFHFCRMSLLTMASDYDHDYSIERLVSGL